MICTKCKKDRPSEEFPVDNRRRSGRYPYCTGCYNEYMFGRSLMQKYGISAAQYKEMLESQGGVCAICGGTGGARRLAVDHCHLTGEIRGLLCHSCNLGLGMLGDTLEIVEKAYLYLKKCR